MMQPSNKKTGVLQALSASLAHSRLGELLLIRGKITPQQLRHSLKLQKEFNQPLGRVLLDQGAIGRVDLVTTLGQQMATRALATCAAAFITVSSFSVPKAHASSATLKDSPVASQFLNQRASLNRALPNTSRNAKIFGSRETRSSDISAFTKWTGIMHKTSGLPLPSRLEGYRNADDLEMIEAVNDYVNSFRYIEDKNNWGRSDYWATPTEFFARGGDCEDFAIAKYAALKALGFPAANMRLAIVQDQKKNIPHAILIVYTAQGALMLDNQIKDVTPTHQVGHYKPIYSINKNAWWRHT